MNGKIRVWLPTGHVLPQSSEDKEKREVLIELYPSPDSYKSFKNFRTLFTDM